MKEHSVLWSSTLKLVRKGREEFAIVDSGNEIIKLPQEIGRKIWLAMLAEETVGWAALLASSKSRQFSRRLLWCLKYWSNCHGTVYWLRWGENNGGIFMDIPSSKTREYKTSFEFHSFFDALATWKFPIFATHWPDTINGSDHSVVILWHDKDPKKFVVFDKWWTGEDPYRIRIWQQTAIVNRLTRFSVKCS